MSILITATVYPKKYAHGFVVLCFVVVKQSFIMNSHELFIHIHQGCFAGTGAIVRLPQCQWSKPDGYGKISQCLTTTKHNKAKTLCIFLGIYCIVNFLRSCRNLKFYECTLTSVRTVFITNLQSTMFKDRFNILLNRYPEWEHEPLIMASLFPFSRILWNFEIYEFTSTDV